ncbi:MAG: hypothetical protein CMJ81_05950 [Planctomycetaceae bacterium]|nr:hypothetical protein [Planctomycetaceae bacterium]MBP63386.1 hypothetical protein [Planctomycetaceae bacterium]
MTGREIPGGSQSALVIPFFSLDWWAGADLTAEELSLSLRDPSFLFVRYTTHPTGCQLRLDVPLAILWGN